MKIHTKRRIITYKPVIFELDIDSIVKEYYIHCIWDTLNIWYHYVRFDIPFRDVKNRILGNLSDWIPMDCHYILDHPYSKPYKEFIQAIKDSYNKQKEQIIEEFKNENCC